MGDTQFYWKRQPGETGLVTSLEVFTKVEEQYVNIPKVVFKLTACITAPQCLHASKRGRVSEYSPDFLQDGTYFRVRVAVAKFVGHKS